MRIRIESVFSWLCFQKAPLRFTAAGKSREENIVRSAGRIALDLFVIGDLFAKTQVVFVCFFARWVCMGANGGVEECLVCTARGLAEVFRGLPPSLPCFL